MSETSSLFGSALRQPPANVQAEAAILGALLADNRNFERIGALQAEHYADAENARLHTAIERRISAGQMVDAVILKLEFEPAYLAGLLVAHVAPLVVPEYARAVHDCFLRRQLCDMAAELDIASRGDDAGCDATDLIAAAQDKLAALFEAATPTTGNSMWIGEALLRVEKRAEAIYKGSVPAALSTGLPTLDNVLGGGIEPATLTIMGGLQESGKTELALHIAEHIAMEQLRAWQGHQRGACPCVLFFEFEMTAEQLSARTAARLGGIARSDIRKGRMTERVTTAFRELEKIGELLPIKFEARSPATLGRFRTAFRTLLRQRKVALVIVDNITRMADAAGIKDMGQAYSAVLNELDNAAKVTGTPVLALCHILKSASTREDGRPRSDDMPYNTGRYPDKAVIVHRPEKMIAPAPPERGAMKEEAWQVKVEQWHKRKAETVNITEIIPAKLREDDGDRRPEMIRLRFDREAGRFIDPLIAAEPPADLWGDVQ